MLRSAFPYLALLILLGAVAWALSFGTLPQADFTFCNGTEIQSVDPAIVTGQPEGRIIQAIFEGLVNWDPKTLEPTPGVADNFRQVTVRDEEGNETTQWEFEGLSDDQLTYTFHIRENAKWSDGSPVTAHDFVYSFRRFIDPMTPNRYVFQLTSYVHNADRYYSPRMLTPGDPVEVELYPKRDLLGIRGEVLRGYRFVERSLYGPAPDPDDEDPPPPQYLYVLEKDGQQHRFLAGGDAGSATSEVTVCRQVLLDFSEVGIYAEDPQTFVVRLKNPTPYFLTLMGFYPLFPVNERCVETHGSPAWTRPENIVTNGAFILKERRLRDRIRLAKNPYYWDRENVRLNTVDALAVESYVTMLNLYEAGVADWIPTVPATSVRALLKQQRKDFHPSPVLTVYFYRINVTRPPLDNKLVRQAISLAINRQEIIDTITGAGEVPAYSLVPPGIPGYTPATTAEYNPSRARELLAQAGYPGGQGLPRIEILYNTSEDHAAIAEMIQQQLRKTLNIDVRLRNEEWNSYLISVNQLQYDLGRAGWIGDYVDPNTFLDMFISDGTNNQTGWRHDEYTRLIEDATSAISATERDTVSIAVGATGPAAIPARLDLLHQAEAILMDELPIVPLYFYVSKNMVRPYVHGFYSNLQDVHPLKAIWIDEEAKRAYWEEQGR